MRLETGAALLLFLEMLPYIRLFRSKIRRITFLVTPVRHHNHLDYDTFTPRVVKRFNKKRKGNERWKGLSKVILIPLDKHIDPLGFDVDVNMVILAKTIHPDFVLIPVMRFEYQTRDGMLQFQTRCFSRIL